MWLSLREPRSLISNLATPSIWGKPLSWRILEGRLGAGLPARGVLWALFSCVLVGNWEVGLPCAGANALSRGFADSLASVQCSLLAVHLSSSPLESSKNEKNKKNESSPGTKSSLPCCRSFVPLLGTSGCWCCACSPLKAQIIEFKPTLNLNPQRQRVRCCGGEQWPGHRRDHQHHCTHLVSRSWGQQLLLLPQNPCFQPGNGLCPSGRWVRGSFSSFSVPGSAGADVQCSPTRLPPR